MVCNDRGMTAPGSLPPGIPQEGPDIASAMSVLAALLDRSVRQIAEAAADVRWFDREVIRMTSDVWDNNLFPLFWAASSANAEERERRALTALEWMARFSERRRRWMTEQATIVGYGLEPLLSSAKPYAPGRDYLGHVMAPMCRLTRQSVDDLFPDYDLATATVRHLRVERASTCLTAFLQLVVPRRYAVEESTPSPPALLNVSLECVTDAIFDLSDTQGAVLDPQVDGVAMSVGRGGRLHAGIGECWWDDRCWHLSAAGRRADAVIPPRTHRSGRPSQPPTGKLGNDARAAAVLLRHAMWEIRSVRYPDHADHVPVLDLCQAFEGAGEAILAAGSRRGSHHREAAFRDLIRTWADRGGPVLARWFAGILRGSAGRSDLIEVPEACERVPPSLTGTVPPLGTPSQATLVMAAWTAAYSDSHKEHPATAQLQLALPPRPDENPSAPWRLRTVSCTEPADFHLHTAAFWGPGSLIQTGKATASSSIDLHRGALFVAAGDGWSASVS